MRVHILGICGTFMGGIALLAKQLGFKVSGSDANVYPPMSVQLEESGIALWEGYHPSVLQPAPDLVIVGNVLSRGNPAVEYVLDHNLPYTSGPQWLTEQVLKDRWVLAVAGTHGKTTTSSMLAWILEFARLSPGFLIGGVAEDFGVSARLGARPFFVIEADEYDTAFFDKRSKFIHYRPRTLIINNIEFDHADIFPDLDAIKRQFHHLVRIVPSTGLILRPLQDTVVDEVLAMGCWSTLESCGEGSGALWSVQALTPDFGSFRVEREAQPVADVHWSMIGRHNAANAVAAIAAANHAGVPPEQACRALSKFKSVKRRLQQLAFLNGITVYDDFAHHPTAIAITIEALRRSVGDARIIAIFEPRSNTMRMGLHQDALAGAFSEADLVLLYQPEDLKWDLAKTTEALGSKRRVFRDIGAIVEHTTNIGRSGDHVVIMSNGSFGGLNDKLIARLNTGTRGN